MDDLRRWVSAALVGSTGLAVFVVLVGMAVAALSGRGLALSEEPVTAGVFGQIGRGEPGGIVLLGLLLLTLTPVAHLTAAGVAFARRGERRYLVTTLLVGAVLAGSLVVAALLGLTAAD